ncbi:MAG: GNAT family N-acetyltransferase [bacterium]
MTFEVVETRDIALCQHLRRVVFTLEQGVSVADEVDGRDSEARHLLALRDGIPVGTARLLTESDYGKIGRVCVLAEARGAGVGAALIRAGVALFRGVPGVSKVKLGAQTHALGFYEALGFHAIGDIYQDAGIAHRDMVLALR